MKNISTPKISGFKIFASMLSLFCMQFLTGTSEARAQVNLSIRQASNFASVKSGDQFVDTIYYACSSLTSNGQNIKATVALPQNLIPYVISPFANSVAFDPSLVASVTYDASSSKINIVFVNPLPAGSTGDIEIKFNYLNGSTPNGYAPDIIASIDGDNFKDASGTKLPPATDTLHVIAQASNLYTTGKSVKAGGAINDLTIYTLNVAANTASGSLDLKDPIVIDTLPAGAVFVEATKFNGSNAPLYNASDNTVTWTWPAGKVFQSYSSSAFLSVRYGAPTFALGDNVCNHINLSGSSPVLPIGTYTPVAVSGSVCSALAAPSANAGCSGGGITAATASWLDHHILAGTTCNWFSNGWYNGGNTQLDEVNLSYDIDKSIDMNTISFNPVYDGFDSVAPATIAVFYKTNLNAAFTSAGTFQSVDIASGASPDHVVPSLASGEYLTTVKFKVTGNLPIGGYQKLGYCGDARTTALKAKDGTDIKEGTYDPVGVIGDDGTVVSNVSYGSFTYNGTTTNFTGCSDVAEIIYAQPAFNNTTKSITNSSDNFRASDTVNYRFHTYLGGNDNATNVVVSDTLDSKLTYVPGSSTFVYGSTSVAITPTISVNGAGKTVLTYQLGTLTPIKDYYINFSAVIVPGTMPTTIPNKMTLSSNNSLFTKETDPVNVNVISAVALRAYKGQSGCDPSFVYYPVNAIAQEGGPVNYKITIKNLGNVVAKNLVLVDVFPFINDFRSSKWYANMAAPALVNDNKSTIYYTTVSNPCFSDFNPTSNPSGCNPPTWTLTPPVDITKVKAIKITRSDDIPVLDSIVLTWVMRAPVGVPVGLLMNNSIMYQANRADNGNQLLPAVPNMVGMQTTCTPVLGSIGNYAWIDSNKNGLQDEPAALGLNGVKVYLYDAGVDGQIGGGDDVLKDSTITANDWSGNPGYYKFVEVPSGKYFLTFPTNYDQYKITPVNDQSPKTDGNSDIDTLLGRTSIVTIDATGSGQDKDNTTIDAGFYPTGSLGNYVWYDENANGLQDEPAANGINGQKVVLYKQDNTGNYVPKDSVTTANDASGRPGYYNFYLTESGNYKVLFPTGVSTKVLTTQTLNAKTNGNSDADVVTGFSPVIVMNLLSSGYNKNNPTIDAGYRCNVPVPVVTGNLQLCAGSSTVLTATGNPTLQWFKDGTAISGATSTTLTTAVAGNTPSPVGSYTVASTDIGGCVSTSVPVNVTIPAPPAQPVVTPLGSTVFCSGNSLQLSSSVATAYQWYKDGTLLVGETNQTVNVTTSGNYTVKVFNNLGCVSSASSGTVVTVNPTPSPTAPTLTTSGQNCVGSVFLTSSPASGYQWYLGGVLIPGATGQVYYPQIPAGAYSVVQTGPTGCLSAPSPEIHAHVNVTPVPSIAVTGSLQVCGGSSVKFDATSGYSSYQWFLNGTAISGATNLSYTTSDPGTYTVVATNGLGCASAPSTGAVVTIVSPPAVPVITGTTKICTGASTVLTSSSDANNQWYFNGNPINNATNKTLVVTDIGAYSVKVQVGNCESTSTVTTVSKSVIADFLVNATTVANVPCLDQNKVSILNNSIGNSTNKWYVNGVLISVNAIPVDTTFTTPNTYNIRLEVSDGNGCNETLSKDVYVYSCSVSSGSGGGVESKSLGAIIGTRNFELYKKGKNGPETYPASQLIGKSVRGGNATAGLQSVSTLAAIMPYQVDATYSMYDKTSAVTDLENFTNAVDVRAIDFTKNQQTKAVAFATKTLGGVYSHTKPICDRLRGAELLKVENIIIQGFEFIRYTLKQEDGSIEYAISFSAGIKKGRDSYSIQSNWMTNDYINEDTLVNYQLWAASPINVTTMVGEVLSRLKANMPLNKLGKSVLPNAYITKGQRKSTALELNIVNNTSYTTGYLELNERKHEDGQATVRTVPITVLPNATQTIVVPVGDAYEADIKMYLNNNLSDLAYMADGIWGNSFDKASASVSSFNVSNDPARKITEGEYPLLRDVKMNVTTSKYFTVYKFLRGGGASQDLTGNKSIKFTATANTGGLNLRLTITKKSVTAWDKQYTYLIKGIEDGKEYGIGTSEFKTSDTSLSASIDLSDVTSVVFSYELPSGQQTNFSAGLANVKFTQEDVAYLRTLEVKDLNIAPNPSQGDFKVTFNSASVKTVKLKVTDLIGRMVYSKSLDAVVGTNSLQVSLRQVSKKGTYFVTLEGPDGKYDVKKVLVDK